MSYQRIPLLIGFREAVGLRDTYGGIDGVVALQAHHLKPDVAVGHHRHLHAPDGHHALSAAAAARWRRRGCMC